MIGPEEKQAVMDVLSGPVLVHGPRAKEFEARFAAYTGSPAAASASSCTAAMHLAYFDLGLGPGDEVIVPAQTHCATAHVVEFCGARPVFADAELATGNLDLDLVEGLITPRTRAIAVVHFLGLPVDMDRVTDLAARHELFVLEDCALALGARYKGVHAGLLGDAGAFSFYPVKHMTTAEGGMLVSRHPEMVERVQRKKAFGVDRTPGERKIPGVYDVTMLGYNYRMNEIQAAMGLEQLKRMDGFLEKRRQNAEMLEAGLREIEELTLFAPEPEGVVGSRYCLSAMLAPARAQKRYELVKRLNEQGVGTSVYYPRPVPHLSYYKDKYGFAQGSFPKAAAISGRSIALPVGPHLGPKDMAYIVETMKQALAEVH
ncbi:MAG: DegT/DnrJ/EryC1/StrS family aminotransferase [Desulfovibrionaceae bacterium]|nr:DegT/DnrJ/EryC1/StrS family aminotransferase [Desulfovibrionaceae bacterium]